MLHFFVLFILETPFWRLVSFTKSSCLLREWKAKGKKPETLSNNYWNLLLEEILECSSYWLFGGICFLGARLLDISEVGLAGRKCGNCIVELVRGGANIEFQDKWVSAAT